jgi:hypothetical protein
LNSVGNSKFQIPNSELQFEKWPACSDGYNPGMRNICWLLIGLAALAFAVGTITAFAHQVFLLEPVGYWRGAVGFLLFAIALRMMDSRS